MGFRCEALRLHLWHLVLTSSNVTNLHVRIACVKRTLTVPSMPLQTASLCLTSTPAEEVALGLCWLLRPLQLLRLPVAEIGAQGLLITIILSSDPGLAALPQGMQLATCPGLFRCRVEAG